jgi:NodT family efflux transporter outer membrane factor (OMF) lipoprotein
MKTIHPFGLAGIGLLLALLAGCTVGPNYQPPKPPPVAQWNAPLIGGETNGPANTTGWWKNFHDPQLDSLVDRAVQSNLDLRIAGARVREARAQYRINQADAWPTVTASGSYARDRESQHQPLLGSMPLPAGIPFENNVYQAGFDANWEMDVFGGNRRAVQAGRAEVAAAQFDQRGAMVTLLGEVARNYASVRGCQRRLALAHANLRVQEDAQGITRNRFTNGLTSELDVQQASTYLATTRAEVPALEQSLAASFHRLGVLLGQPPGALVAELSVPKPIPAALPPIPVGLPSELLRRRPDVQAAEQQLAAATARIGVATADLFPKFSLTGSAGFQSVSASDWFTAGSRFWSAGPTVQWKIFDAGRIRANIRVQDARQEQALAQYEKVVLTSFEEVENALTAYAKEQTRLQALADAEKSGQESLHLANELYTNGLSNFINVLDAERSLFQTEDALGQSEEAVMQDLIALYKALGGGWETGCTPVTLATGNLGPGAGN